MVLLSRKEAFSFLEARFAGGRLNGWRSPASFSSELNQPEACCEQTSHAADAARRSLLSFMPPSGRLKISGASDAAPNAPMKFLMQSRPDRQRCPVSFRAATAARRCPRLSSGRRNKGCPTGWRSGGKRRSGRRCNPRRERRSDRREPPKMPGHGNEPRTQDGCVHETPCFFVVV
jgi:hypothetical protein